MTEPKPVEQYDVKVRGAQEQEPRPVDVVGWDGTAVPPNFYPINWPQPSTSGEWVDSGKVIYVVSAPDLDQLERIEQLEARVAELEAKAAL